MRANTTGMLYVLDEPSVGLHPSNIEGLRSTIGMLAANGNSVVMVEHEIEIINAADWVIELGPGAGAHGGTVVAQGTPAEIRASEDSVIGPFLAGKPAVRRAPRPTDGEAVTVEGADLYNLHDVRVSFPEQAMTAVAGPSGAGKTALILESLVPALRASLAGEKTPRHVRRLTAAGTRGLAEIDATPIGQNSRSTPATYSGAFDAIRQAFADTPLARRRRWKPGLERFAGRPAIVRPLRPVDDVGLGYLRMGEETPSLSGGESQRLRIASRLRSSQRGILYVFDEPSTGLHPVDITTTLTCSRRQTTSSTWARSAARTAAVSSPRARRRTWPRTPIASPAPTWPVT